MNLFICTTTFQLSMAVSIIRKEKIKKTFVIYLKSEINERDINKLSELSVNYKIVKNKFDKIKVLSFLLYNHIENIYISSINNTFVWFVCSFFKGIGIYSFDDGTANYIKSGYFYNEIKLSKYNDFMFRILFLEIRSIIDIKHRIKKHYAFCELENIIDNTEVINIVEEGYYNIECNKKIDVFILPCASEFFISPNIEFFKISKLITEKTILITHPRDKSGLFISTYKRNESAEDIISNLLKNGYFINLYGYANTTQLIYSRTLNIKNKIITSNNISRKFINGYKEQIKLMEKLYVHDNCEFIKL